MQQQLYLNLKCLNCDETIQTIYWELGSIDFSSSLRPDVLLLCQYCGKTFSSHTYLDIIRTIIKNDKKKSGAKNGIY